MTLPEPRTSAGRAGLAAVLAEPAAALVALDFDGTLSPIVPRPQDARLAAGGLEALQRLARAVGRLAIVSGRPAGTILELGGLAAVSGLVIAGQYGAERWADGELSVAPPLPGIAALRETLPATLAGSDPGVRIEDKVSALVVHTRRASDPAGAQAALAEPLAALAEQHGLEAKAGRYVIELRPPGFDKGGALRALVAEFAPRAVLFAGDDLGDLPAYDAVEALRADGLPGVTVCAGSPEAAAVAERADIVVDGPEGVVALLATIAQGAG